MHPPTPRARFFATPAAFRVWLEANHATADELLVGFHKKGSGRPSITWPESVDEALCVGWIDGIRNRLNEVSYTIRFTPRRKGSLWSAVNIARATVLASEGRMRPAGLAAFAKRIERKSSIDSYEQRPREFEEPYRSQFRKHKAAWTFFNAQPPSYRRNVIWWLASAKQRATRERRFAALIAASANAKRL